MAALEAERMPTPDPERTLRHAAQLVHDAMRLLERFPSDAAPHVTRQLTALLPDDVRAGYVVAEAVRVAGKYESASEARSGRSRERRPDDDWRDRRSSYGR